MENQITNELYCGEIKSIYKTYRRPLHKMTDSKSSYDYIFNKYDSDTIALKESFYIMLLNKEYKIIGYNKLSDGHTSACLVDIKYIIKTICDVNASAIILSHNHPSGNMKPSKGDIDLSKKIQKACSYLDVLVLDHIIVSPYGDEYYSMADNGLI